MVESKGDRLNKQAQFEADEMDGLRSRLKRRWLDLKLKIQNILSRTKVERHCQKILIIHQSTIK